MHATQASDHELINITIHLKNEVSTIYYPSTISLTMIVLR